MSKYALTLGSVDFSKIYPKEFTRKTNQYLETLLRQYVGIPDKAVICGKIVEQRIEMAQTLKEMIEKIE